MKKAQALMVIALAGMSLISIPVLACNLSKDTNEEKVSVVEEVIPNEVIPNEVNEATFEIIVEGSEVEVIEERTVYKIPDEYVATGGYMSEELLIYAEELCADKNVSYPLVLAMIEKESGYQNLGKNDHNCIGYMQISEKWHQDTMERIGCTDLYDGFENVAVGVEILASMFEEYEDASMVLMAYNMGQSGAAELWEKGTYSSSYSRSVLSRASEISNELYGE